MNKIESNKKKILIISFALAVFIILIVVSKLYASADDYAGKVTIEKAEITKVLTGTEPFSDIDVSADNNIVRSFDTVTYNVNFKIKPTDEAMSNENIKEVEDRTVEVKAKLTKEEAEYASFEIIQSTTGSVSSVLSEDKTEITYIYKGLNSYSNYNENIKLNIKNANNYSKISPTFTIKESTESTEKDVPFNIDTEKQKELTITSKSDYPFDIEVIPSNETQSVSDGRYVTFGIILKETNVSSIKGMQLPTGDISFNIELSQDNNKDLVIDEKNIRPYRNENIDDINAVNLGVPYDTGSSVTAKKTDKGYLITIKDFTKNYIIQNNNDAIISTIAVTALSKREKSDAKNDINVKLVANAENSVIAKTFDNKDIKEVNLNNNTATIKNEYIGDSDYKILGTFINKKTKTSLSNFNNKERNVGVVTRGDELAYKSSISLTNTRISKTGIIDIIKFDPNAFELMSYDDDNDYILDIDCINDDCSLTKDDIIVKYLTGNFTKDNFEVVNYSDDSMTDESFYEEDKSTIQSQCLNVKNNYNSLTSDQIMNLYGGPCLKPLENTEKEYTNIKDIPSGKNITKVVLETKDGKKLSSKETINLFIGLRIKNVTDISQTYQATTLVKSKGNSSVTYFSPKIDNSVSSAANYNNYKKTTYKGNTPTVDDKDYADSVRVVNYTATNSINITNKNNDGTKKTTYNSVNNEILNYKIDLATNDNSMVVGADDVWYIKSFKVTVVLSKYLEYSKNDSYLTPASIINNNDGTTTLVYNLPYTKTNRTVAPILFDAKFKQNIKGSNNEVIVSSKVETINVNDDIYVSSDSAANSVEKIFVNGIEGITINSEVLDGKTKVEKNNEFAYKLSIYNNTNTDIKDLSIMDILPYNNDKVGSEFNGSYKVKLELPANLLNLNIYCYNDEPSKLIREVDNVNNKWTKCNIKNEYVSTSAIKIENISINNNSKLDSIIVKVLPNDNNYGNKYSNQFYAKTSTLTQSESNISKVEVVNRTISGQVFLDVNKNGIKDDNNYIKGIVTTLCKLDSHDNCKNVATTDTDENGKYIFDKLEIGRYKVNFTYDTDLYDVTDRYFTSDETIDSDAYKLTDNGVAEISGKTGDIKVTNDIEAVSNLDMGLISRKEFEVSIKKGINHIDLINKGESNSYNYNFEKNVSLSIKRPNNLTGKVIYAFSITNSTKLSGYVKLIEETIPEGMSFNPNYEENKGWFSVDGKVYYDGLKDTVIKPNEEKSFFIALDINPRNEAGTFLNQVSILELEQYNEEEKGSESVEPEVNTYKIGSELTYGGVKFHIIADDGDNITLLADEDEVKTIQSHTSEESETYKWSTSKINSYLNNTWIKTTSIDTSILIDNQICDDASGINNNSYGGTLKSEGKCISGIYTNSKVRLLTEDEYLKLKSITNDMSFVIGKKDYWLMNSVAGKYSETDTTKLEGNTNSNLAKYSVSGSSPKVSNKGASTKLLVRPVITVPKINIIFE